MSNLAPLPPGFVLMEPEEPASASEGMPPLPPGFELMPDEAASAPAPQYGGVGMNATAGANEALYGVLGAPVDLMRGAMNLGIRGVNAVAGTDVGMIPDDSFGGSRSIAGAMGAIAPQMDPRNTVAASTVDRLGRGIGGGVAGAVVPAGILGGLARAGTVGPEAARMGASLLGRAGSVTDAALGAAGGAGAAIGQEIAPERYKPLAALGGGLLGGGVGALAMSAGRAGRNILAPFTSGGREMLAGRRIDMAASNPQGLRQSLANPPAPLVPGSMPTTGQMTGDLGVLGLERGAAVRAPEAFAQRRSDQNAARGSVLGGIETGGAPERVAASVRQHLDAIDAESERTIGAATEEARRRAAAAGAPMTPDVAGGNMRQAIETARAAAKDRERALWSAVDPHGTMTLGLGNTRKSAHDLVEDMSPLAAPMNEAERQIYTAIGKAGEALPFRAMQDLQANLKSAMRAERMANGESPVYRRMSIVSAGIAKDFDDAVAGKVAQEAQAVARGEMSVEDSLLARWEANLATDQGRWSAGKPTTANVTGGGTSVGGYAGGRAGAVPGVPGATGQGTRGLAGAPRDPGLSPNAGGAGFDAAAFDRLSAANAATRYRVATFDNPTLRPIRQRPTTAAPYTMPAGTIPARIFNSAPKSFEAIGQLRAAIGDKAATEAVQGYAVGQVLRAAGRPDGTLNPSSLAAWRRSHADALRALPELDAKLADAGSASQAIAEVTAARKAASDAAQKGALGRLIQVDAPEDVTRIVGGVFSAEDAVARMRSIRQAIGNDPEAAQGLRRAVVEHMAGKFIGNTEAGTSGLGTMKADGFQSFLRRNEAALGTAGFSREEIATLHAIADDLQQAGRSISAVKNPGDSNSAEKLYQIGKDASPFSAAARMILGPGGVGIGVGVASGSASGIAATAATAAFAAMRNAGLRTVDDLVTDALLNPERARLLLDKVKPGEEAGRWDALARSFGQSAARALSQVEPDAGQPDGRRTDATPVKQPAEHMRRIAEALMGQKSGAGGASGSRNDLTGDLGPVLTATGSKQDLIAQALIDQGKRQGQSQPLDPEREALVKAILKRSSLAYGQNAV